MLWPVQDASRGGVPKKLNRFQTEALDIANSNNFTLIQGPPGKCEAQLCHLQLSLSTFPRYW